MPLPPSRSEGFVMRALAVILLIAFAVPVSAADKNEDKAKDAAIAFLKAVKAKDTDAVLKATATPFAYKEGEEVKVLKDADAFKKWLTDKLDEIKDADKVPTEVEAVHPFADIKDKIKDADQKKAIEEVVGKDGFVAVVKTPDGKHVPILVRLTDGKAAVVGLGR